MSVAQEVAIRSERNSEVQSHTLHEIFNDSELHFPAKQAGSNCPFLLKYRTVSITEGAAMHHTASVAPQGPALMKNTSDLAGIYEVVFSDICNLLNMCASF